MNDELGEITNSYTITFKRKTKHSASRMWRALTDPDEVAAWMEAPVNIDPRVGGNYDVFVGTDSAEKCVIVRVEPERVLTYVWGMNRPDAWGNKPSVVQWVIEGADDGCAYTFMHNGCAATLADRFTPECGGGDNHGHTSQLNPAQQADLISYLEVL